MTTTEVDAIEPGWVADDSTFGARLALVRQRMGWGNIKIAAQECGIPTESWRTWERDDVMPRDVRERALAIAERTGCDYGWLLAGPRLRAPGSRVLTRERSRRLTGSYHLAGRTAAPLDRPPDRPDRGDDDRPVRLTRPARTTRPRSL